MASAEKASGGPEAIEDTVCRRVLAQQMSSFSSKTAESTAEIRGTFCVRKRGEGLLLWSLYYVLPETPRVHLTHDGARGSNK